MQLGYLASQYPAFSHTFILREVRRLRELGIDIHVLSINPPDRPYADLTAEEQDEAQRAFVVKQAGLANILGAHFATLASRPVGYLRGLGAALALAGPDPRRLLFGLFYFVEAVIVGKRLQDLGLEHLHVHFATPAAMVALLCARVFPITYSITVHGPDEFYDVTGQRLAAKVAGASFVCCIGSYAQSQLMKLSDPGQWGKFEISPLGVDAQIFQPRPAHPVPDPFEVICVGRLVPAKGQHILVSAIHQLVSSGRSVRLRIVGDGPDRSSLEARVRELGLELCVRFEGAVDQDRIRELYEQADAFALASFAEGIPVVLMEAMAMEIPCVTTCITGIPELIRDGVDGLLVMPSDVDALEAALARLMDDPDLRERIGADGRKRVLDRYHLERNVERLASIFRRRLGAGA